EGDDAADGQVEESRHDDECHPEGGEDQRPELSKDVVEIGGGQELRFDDRRDDHQQGDRHEDRVVPQEVDGSLRAHPTVDRLSCCAHTNSNALAMISSAEAILGSNSPLIRPSLIVLTRLLMWRTSGSSDEIRMIESAHYTH